MSKIKNWAWDCATNFLDKIENDVKSQKITKSEALEKIKNSDEMLSLEGINNSEDAEIWVDSIHVNNTLLEAGETAIYMDLNDGPPVEEVIDNMKETNLNLWGENE